MYVHRRIIFALSNPFQDAAGTNVYAVLSTPRTPGTEAMVISASWLSRTDDGLGTLNLRGIATVLSLAGFLKRRRLQISKIAFVS